MENLIESLNKNTKKSFKIATESSRTGTELLHIKLNTPNDNYMKYRKANANINLINRYSNPNIS